MPENKPQLPQPRNILEAINLNVYMLGENLKLAMDEIAKLQQEVASLKAMFNAPEQPNALGGDGAAE